MKPDVFEHNLRLLLARSWRPVKPSEEFQVQLGARLE